MNGKTEVIVETGIVEVTRKKQIVRLKPQQKVIVNFTDSALIKESVNDQLYKYYRKKEFICNNTPLSRLVETLNEAYNANIVIENNEIKKLPITTIFKEERLDKVLTVISETLDIKVVKQQDRIVLK
jgi:ferric-dicitrate binding protein FerR (iron transport regulator)